MPELPDVEIYKRYMDSTSLKKKIRDVHVETSKVLSGISKRSLTRKLKGKKFLSTSRRGKYLFAELGKGEFAVFHFGMTGEFRYYKNEKDEPEYSKVIFDFSNGYHLAFINPRKLGRVGIVESKEDFIGKKSLGADALSIKFDEFKKILGESRGGIKYTLMDQKKISGIGNIYSDEILFQAGIHPEMKASEISQKKQKELFNTMKRVLKTAIRNDAKPNKLPSSYLISHRGKGGKCPKCGQKLKNKKVAGRPAYFCKKKQKK